MNDYILKDVLLVPTEKASRYDFCRWIVAEKVPKQESHFSLS